LEEKPQRLKKNISDKSAIVQSYGKVIGEIEVRPKVYNCKSPEFILKDVLVNNTDFKIVDYPISSGITIDKYISEGKIFDIIDDLISLLGAIFYTDGSNTFHFMPKSFMLRTNTFVHGTNSRIWECKFDDTQLVNDLTIIGEQKTYNTLEKFCGTGSQTVYTLNHQHHNLYN